MNLHDFSHDVVPILQLCVTLIGLSSLFLIWWQAKRTTRWNQLQSHHQFFKDTPSAECETKTHQAAKRLGIDLQAPLNAQAVETIDQDNDAHLAIQAFLNEFEELCTAIEMGTLGEDIAYAVDSSGIRKIYRVYVPLIDFWQKKEDDPALFTHIKAVALRWEMRELTFREKERKALARSQQKIKELEARVQKKRDAIRKKEGPARFK